MSKSTLVPPLAHVSNYLFLNIYQVLKAANYKNKNINKNKNDSHLPTMSIRLLDSFLLYAYMLYPTAKNTTMIAAAPAA
ncbi:hypothetical protein Hanom_Chr04g00331301 [Helianthus anomalus]